MGEYKNTALVTFSSTLISTRIANSPRAHVPGARSQLLSKHPSSPSGAVRMSHIPVNMALVSTKLKNSLSKHYANAVRPRDCQQRSSRRLPCRPASLHIPLSASQRHCLLKRSKLFLYQLRSPLFPQPSNWRNRLRHKPKLFTYQPRGSST